MKDLALFVKCDSRFGRGFIMRNANHNSRNMIWSICVILVLWAPGACAAVSSPSPDNAALLYYQASLRRPEFDDDTFLHFDSVLRGAQPDEEVREYLNMVETRETLSIAEAATKILDCSWGIVLRARNGSSLNTVLAQLRQLAFLLEVDARTLAFDGDYRAAFDRCLSIRRLAHHIADEGIIGYLVSLSLHGRAFRCIQHILSSMSPDADTLTWLQAQLGTVQGAPPSPGRAMEITLDDILEFYRMYPASLAEWRENILERIEDENVRQEFLNLTDEEFLDRVRISSESFLASLNRVIGGDMPYLQKNVELQVLKEERADHVDYNKPADIPYLGDDVDDVIGYHDIYVGHLTSFNAIRAAIEIYIMKAETGQLPEILPPHLPEDPFSGQDFEYEVTGQDFVLRRREKTIGNNKLWEYEFVVVQ
ncbi:MAG: hypothetical protein CEE38_08850 [Planctomycetes bacterium B3_Pla]|nr:MAG: hypothetical protein CEE38_08850 [Planctomycetes bacterium B3_Pla]